MTIRSRSIGALAAALLLAAPVTSVWAAHRADAQQAIARAQAVHEQAIAAGAASDTAALIKQAQALLPSRGYSKAIELAEQARAQDESALAKVQEKAAAGKRAEPVAASSTSPTPKPEASELVAPAAPPVPQAPPVPLTAAAATVPALAPPAPVPSAYPPQRATAAPAASRTPAAASAAPVANKFTIAEAEAAVAAAEAARKKADSVGGEWRDTAQMIKDAGDLVKAGQFDAAVKLANQARRQGELGYDQAIGEQTAGFPSYMQHKTP